MKQKNSRHAVNVTAGRKVRGQAHVSVFQFSTRDGLRQLAASLNFCASALGGR